MIFQVFARLNYLFDSIYHRTVERPVITGRTAKRGFSVFGTFFGFKLSQMNLVIMLVRLISIVLVFIYCSASYASFGKEPTSSKRTIHGDKGIFSGTHDTNLIKNPNFENQTSSWLLGKYNGGSALLTTDTIQPLHGKQSALVITEHKGHQYNDVQLFTFFELRKQSSYDIYFEAEVDNTCEVSITVSNGFETFYEARFALKSGKHHYGPFSFVGKQDDQFSYFSFNLGRTKTQIRLDQVMIRANHSKREFDEMITKSGINFHFYENESMICVSAPTEAQTDLPILLYDRNNNLVSTYKIRKGSKEANITLHELLDKGNYLMKVFTRDEQETFHFAIN
jgi:hypothetical protein